MNTLQALAVGAAALAISGDPWGSTLIRAEARLSSFLTRSEAFADEIVANAAAHLREGSCTQRQDAPFASAKHGLPDTSIHTAASAARL